MHHKEIELLETKYALNAAMRDNVNSPAHYNQHGIECIAAIEASMTPEQFKGYLKGSVLKYLWRMDYKSTPVENAKKAEWYLKQLINRL